MNFWEYKEDNSRGYWLPTSNKRAYRQGNSIASGLFLWIILLMKAAWAILKGTGYLLFMMCLGLYKLIKYMAAKRKHRLSP